MNSVTTDRLTWPRHVVVCLHGVRVAPGANESWPEEFEARASPIFSKRVEVIARSYGGVIFNKVWASATWMPWYRRLIVGREDAYFRLLRHHVGPKTRLSVIAHSFGGYIVQELLHRDHTFHRVILVAPAADANLDWFKIQDYFGLARVYWSQQDGVINHAYYGRMGYEGPRVRHPWVQEIKESLRHSGYFQEPYFTKFIAHSVDFLES